VLRHRATILRDNSSIPALARFFPRAVPMRTSVSISGTDRCGRAFNEQTRIELGTPTEMIFTSALPFESGDNLRVINKDGSLDVTVTVVATRYHNGKTAVAARVLDSADSLPIRKH